MMPLSLNWNGNARIEFRGKDLYRDFGLHADM